MRLILALFFALNGLHVLAQGISEEEIEKASEEEKIAAGDYYFENKQYRLSLLAWNSLLKDYPDNIRLNYMAAKCLLNTRGRKDEALAYLRKIETHIGTKVKMHAHHFEEVPVDGHFLLGQALHHNAKMDEAIAQFNLYITKGGTHLTPKEKSDAQRWIKWCENAKVMLADPDEYTVIKNLGKAVNTEADEYSPVLSLDESVLYFTSRRLRKDSTNKNVISDEIGTYYEDVYVALGGPDGKWTEPELITFEGHEVDENEATVSVSADGVTVYIYMDHNGGGDLYSSDYIDESMFSRVENMGGDICGEHWETHCSITPDANVLFFTSNRPGGYGGLDIYRAIRLPNGEWSKAEALPPPINTPYDEDAPFIHPSGDILFYSSNCDKSMGEYDVFYSKILEQQPLKFAEPVNLRSPVNTLDNDLFMVINAEGNRGYYSSSRDGGYGAQDLYMVTFKKPAINSFALLKGFVKMVDGSKIPDNIRIDLDDPGEAQPLMFKPRKLDGGFVMILKPCQEYTMEYFKGDSSLKAETFKVPCNSGYQEIYRELYLDTLYLPLVEAKDTGKIIPVVEQVPSAYFEQFFGYNKNQADDKKEYQDLLKAIQANVKVKGKAAVRIEASASRVPTSSFPSNDALAKTRADNFKKQLLKDLKKLGVKENLVTLTIKSAVQGPAYANDYDANSVAYRKFQYIKAWTE